MRVFCDNKAAVDCISLAYPVKLRHCLQKNLQYVREAAKTKKIKVKWILSEDQLADIMTKALSIKPHCFKR